MLGDDLVSKSPSMVVLLVSSPQSFSWPSPRPASLNFFAAPFRHAGRLSPFFLRRVCGLESFSG